MSGRFAGKVVIVTGSSSGIGQDSAVGFAKEGASVTIHGQSAEKLQTTKDLLKQAGVDEERVLLVLGSLEDVKTVDKIIAETVAKFGRIDVLVNNAGIAKHPSAERFSITGENFDYVMAVNVKAPMLLTEKAAPHLEKTRGNVVVISSAVSIRTHPQSMVYSMSNAARDHFVRNAANIYTPRGIRINGINPGLIRTPFRTRLGISEETEQAIQDALVPVIPSRRAGEPSDVTSVILFLASEQASYVTGAMWTVDGGITTAPVSGTQSREQMSK
ncbi:short-chain dehydrogenease/reductase-like protein [Aphelenchoides avenae]|nr:short-chain dehydrogenease/reductase-like protein [Aphelenchus avenae]